ncbi:MAG: GNAT family N-acetyltransferase [Gemmatimonadota bacterium]|nr:GNAT family N-acetyltransferase [Gemmatimonadota bacterium]
MSELATVATDRLLLRRVRADAWQEQRLIDADPRVMETLGGLRDPKETQEYMQQQAAHWTRHGFGLWSIHDRSTGDFVGRGGLRYVELDDGELSIEVGYALIPSCWGRGLATEVASEAMEIGDRVLGLDRIIGITLPWNQASRNVLEKVGLTYLRDTEYRALPHALYEWVRTP